MRVVWTDQALARLIEIERHIANDDPVAAVRYVDLLVTRGEELSELPHRGHRVPELPQSGLREIIEGNYRIVYRIGADVVEILTVFEGHYTLAIDVVPDRDDK